MGRIIVVEDNPVFADYVCRLLASKDFQSVSTFNCNDARKLFAKMQCKAVFALIQKEDVHEENC